MTVSGGGKALPQSSGGYPGNTEYDVAIRNSDIHQLIEAGRLARSLDDLAGEREVMPPHPLQRARALTVPSARAVPSLPPPTQVTDVAGAGGDDRFIT